MHKQLTHNLWPDGDPNPVLSKDMINICPSLKYKYHIGKATCYSSTKHHAIALRNNYENYTGS